jgi:hypothetical protein
MQKQKQKKKKKKKKKKKHRKNSTDVRNSLGCMQNFWHTHRCQGILYDDESRLIDFHIPLFHSINVVSNILHNTLSSVLF